MQNEKKCPKWQRVTNGVAEWLWRKVYSVWECLHQGTDVNWKWTKINNLSSVSCKQPNWGDWKTDQEGNPKKSTSGGMS